MKFKLRSHIDPKRLKMTPKEVRQMLYEIHDIPKKEQIKLEKKRKSSK